MASTPWTITKRKRPSIPATGTRSRKRARLSGPPFPDDRRQQTLTQAQWVPSRPMSFQDEPLLRPSASGSARTNKRGMSTRDSTLTQMDFFNPLTMLPNTFDDAPLPVDDGNDAPAMPQLDGSYSSPRKPRAKKSSDIKPRSATMGMKQESQEYLPPNHPRSRGFGIKGSSQTPRRTSRRLADSNKSSHKILSDPASNYRYFERALSQSPAKQNHTEPPLLEIQDSTATNDDIFDLPPSSQRSPRSAAPRTPQKPRTVVLSSQSPESLPPTIRRSVVKHDALRQLRRSPLRERSINMPSPARQTTSVGRKLDSSRAAPPALKIVRLKLPKSTTNPPKSSVDDSQNIWSLPVTSSPQKRKSPESRILKDSPAAEDSLAATVRVPSNSIEIPDTSQALQKSSRQNSGHQQPSLNGVSEQTRGIDHQFEQQQERPEVVVRDFAHLAEAAPVVAAEKDSGGVPSLRTPAKSRPAFIADSDSEYGSPIANDTQFNEEVAKRTSSPRTISENSLKTVSTEILSDAALKAVAARRLQNVRLTEDDTEAPMMPTPRLIHSSSRPLSREEEPRSDPSSEEGLILPQIMPNTHKTQTQTTRVPLNDALPSSSPPLQTSRSITQRSTVRPASMPHPSQISTQEATQYGMSSMVVDEPNETPLRTERITIKDSSSMRIPLSQIPPHGSSPNGLNIDLGLAALDEVDDRDQYDLNRSSTPSEDAPIVTNDKITRLASKRKADLSPLRPSITKKKRRTPTQVLPLQQDPDLSSEEEVDLDPKSSHHTSRRRPSIPDDATESQDFTSTAGTTSNIPSSHNPSTTALPTPRDEPNKANEPPHSSTQPQSPSQSQPESQSITSSPPFSSSENPSPLREQHSPIPGFNNETQSNFTQGGHVSAAYVHKQKEKEILPPWYTPKPYKVPGYTRR